MNDGNPPPTPVVGEVFGRSAVKTFGFVVLNIFLFLFGTFLIWAYVNDKVLDPGPSPKRVTGWGFAIGIGGVIGAPVMAVLLLRAYWVRRRIVVGIDRFQIVEHLGGEDVVVLDIPFSNIAAAQYEVTSTERRVAIDLHRTDDPNTYVRGGNFQTAPHVESGRVCITGGYKRGPRAIATAMERALESWRHR